MNDRSYISATIGELRGVAAVEPTLRLAFNVEAGGLADGASAMFLATANIESGPGRILGLGTAAPVLKLLGFPERDGEEDVYKTSVCAEWRLTDTAIERIEKLRDGGDLTIYPNLEYALISRHRSAGLAAARAADPGHLAPPADKYPDRLSSVGDERPRTMATGGCSLPCRGPALCGDRRAAGRRRAARYRPAAAHCRETG